MMTTMKFNVKKTEMPKPRENVAKPKRKPKPKKKPRKKPKKKPALRPNKKQNSKAEEEASKRWKTHKNNSVNN